MVYLGTFICISSEIKVGDREVDHSNDIADCIYWMTVEIFSQWEEEPHLKLI